MIDNLSVKSGRGTSGFTKGNSPLKYEYTEMFYGGNTFLLLQCFTEL